VRTKLQLLQRFFLVASVLMGLVVTGLISAVITMNFAIHGAEVKVPALKGMTVAEARSQTSGLGLNLEVDNRYYSADVAAGHILSQSPAVNAVVRREWRVRVAESLGPQKVEVPGVVGANERSAALNLRRVGLETGTVARLPWTAKGMSTGTVLAQDPPARAQGIERPGINLLVAEEDTSAPDGFVMPELTGLPIITAQSLLTRVGIKFGEPKFVDSAIRPVTGNVTAPGASAGAALNPVGTSAGSAPAPPAPAPIRGSALPGVVVGQSPPAGFRVEVGSTVALSVAK
jgi:beta-lactam-binding protein with PASTA domain